MCIQGYYPVAMVVNGFRNLVMIMVNEVCLLEKIADSACTHETGPLSEGPWLCKLESLKIGGEIFSCKNGGS